MSNLIPALLFSKPVYHFFIAGYFQSFSKASQHLHVDQTTISHSIKTLEDRLNTKLFHRLHKKIKFTNNGRLLYQSIEIGKLPIEQVLQKIKDSTFVENRVVLSVSTATATHLVLPNIAEFKKNHPDIEIKCITNDIESDFINDNADLAIPLGLGPWTNLPSWHFADEEIMPVCSPEYAAGKIKDIHSIDLYSLCQLDLINIEERQKSRFDWQDWFRHFDKSIELPKASLTFTDYSIVLQMAIKAYGVALGWKHIVNPLIEQGLLRQVGTKTMKTNHPFVILSKNQTPMPKSTKAFLNWLKTLA